MIKSTQDYKYYIEADRIAKCIPKKRSISAKLKYLLFPNEVWEFQKCLRKLEYYKNVKKGPLNLIYRVYLTRRFNRLSRNLGFSIPTNVIGPGLSIAHKGTIIINGGAKIGSNCRLHAMVNIGTEAGQHSKAPQIGDNCYIGPGVKMYGAILIADGTAMGANAVVNKSVLEENTAIAGIPAKKIGEVNPWDLLVPASIIVDSKYTGDIYGLTASEIKEKLVNEGILS